jgi:uncharacterized protein YbjT (DUF2867 family)
MEVVADMLASTWVAAAAASRGDAVVSRREATAAAHWRCVRGGGGVILVIGATGTVGAQVVLQLVAVGERPRGFVRDINAARRQLGEQPELVVGDLDRPETIEAALDGVDRVFLMTTQSSRQPEWEQRVIEVATGAGVDHLVKLSVFRADEHSLLQVARQHRRAELALEQSTLAWTILRPVFFMENVRAMVRDDALFTAARDGRVAMIDSRDIAAVAAAALTRAGHEGNTYTLTGPEALSFDDVASRLSEHFGRRIRHMRVAEGDVRTALQARGVVPWFADDMAKLHGMLADGYEEVVTEDVHKVTGSPARSFTQFMRDTGGI